MTKKIRPRLTKEEFNYIEQRRKYHPDRRVLIIGDPHVPFGLAGYFDWTKTIADKYQVTDIVCIGDLVDLHASSFHESDPDGMSAGDELKAIREPILKLATYFPNMKVCNGNHDSIPNRKAFSSGLSKRWIKSIKEILLEDGLPVEGWEFAEDFVIDNVMYTHGTGRKARSRGQKDIISIVQGHYHSEGYIEHYVGIKTHIFTMQVGCGIDRKSYAMAYGKHFDKPHISCGVILENGKLPILEYMPL
jgi:metallophosphoesterase superfamily enzyme